MQPTKHRFIACGEPGQSSCTQPIAPNIAPAKWGPKNRTVTLRLGRPLTSTKIGQNNCYDLQNQLQCFNDFYVVINSSKCYIKYLGVAVPISVCTVASSYFYSMLQSNALDVSNRTMLQMVSCGMLQKLRSGCLDVALFYQMLYVSLECYMFQCCMFQKNNLILRFDGACNNVRCCTRTSDASKSENRMAQSLNIH